MRKANKNRKTVIGVSLFDGSVIRLTGNQEIEAAGFTMSNVSRCCNGERKHHGGYTWRHE